MRQTVVIALVRQAVEGVKIGAAEPGKVLFRVIGDVEVDVT